MSTIERARSWLADDGDCHYSKVGCAITSQIMRDLIAELESRDNHIARLAEGNSEQRVFSLPRSLTAENGAKALLIGDFHEITTISCPECDGDEDYVDGCSTCHGQGYINQRVTVEWDTIKRIYDKVVTHFTS